jgi:8-oxo-dGTP pyrophosphatase MutT (NUDIX family)
MSLTENAVIPDPSNNDLPQSIENLPHNGSMNTRWKPSVTVAAVIEESGRFLLVEEHTPEGLRLNNPAGHLDPGESPAEACARETLEETAYQFTPQALVGVYLARFQRSLPDQIGPAIDDITYLRFAFCGSLGARDALRTLDTGIVGTLWLTADEIRANTNRLRSPLVLQCMEDYLAGQRFGLELIHTHPSVQAFQPRT